MVIDAESRWLMDGWMWICEFFLILRILHSYLDIIIVWFFENDFPSTQRPTPSGERAITWN